MLKFIGDIWHKFLHLFVNLTNQAFEVYKELPQDLQDALKHGVGVIAVINTMLRDEAVKVQEAIKSHFPELNESELEAKVFELLNHLGITGAKNLLDAISLIQQYLLRAEKSGLWQGASFTVSALLGWKLAPVGTGFSVVTQVIDAVYQKLIRPKVVEPTLPKDNG